MVGKNGEIEDRFFYSTDGECDIFGFGDKVLWNSVNDNYRDEKTFKPYIIEIFNEWINELSFYEI